MIKAKGIKWKPAKKGGFIVAKINKLPYQHWFEDKPSKIMKKHAISSFEMNYAGLKDSARVPVKVKQHHSEL